MQTSRRRTPFRQPFRPLRTGAALLVVAGLLGAATGFPVRLLPGDPAARPAIAGCLAPADTAVDGAGAIGVLWGNGSGDLFYARNLTGAENELVRRENAALPEVLAREGEANEFFVGASRERWSVFHAGSMNENGDFAHVATTLLPDDPGTPQNEALPRRGAYVRRGNTDYRIGRAGSDSPIPLGIGGRVPWGTFFDAAILGRTPGGTVDVFFSAQLGNPDGRTGIFRWSETTGEAVPFALTGDAAPSGGTFVSLGRIRANESGDVAFFAATQVGSDAENASPGLFLVTRDGTRLRVLRGGLDGDPAPGGGTFRQIGDLDVAGDGTILFLAALDGGPAGSALFRAAPPLFTVERVLAEGEATPVGGVFGKLTGGVVRCDESGDAVLLLAIPDEFGGQGLFTLAPGGDVADPLGTVPRGLLAAALGAGRAGYQTQDDTRIVAPADGSQEGPTDFRVVLADVRNAVALRSDVLQADVRFVLPPWTTAAPASFRADATRNSTTTALTGAALSVVREVRFAVSQNPGQDFAFGVSAGSAPTGTASVNGNPLTVKKFTVTDDGARATWAFTGNVGSGSFTCDLVAGTAVLRTSRGNLQPSFEPLGFKVAFTVRTDADVTANRTGDDAFFHRDVRISAGQPAFGSGRRVLTRGESVPGGTLFVDALRVDRALRVVRGQSAPDVTSDKLTLTGTLRLCPGATPPVTPSVGAVLTIGSFTTGPIELTRVGKRGSKYRFSGAAGGASSLRIDVDAAGGTFTVKGAGLPPLPELADADFADRNGPNASVRETGGMTLPFALRVDRVYEAGDDLPVRRLPGGKRFVR